MRTGLQENVRQPNVRIDGTVPYSTNHCHDLVVPLDMAMISSETVKPTSLSLSLSEAMAHPYWRKAMED